MDGKRVRRRTKSSWKGRSLEATRSNFASCLRRAFKDLRIETSEFKSHNVGKYVSSEIRQTIAYCTMVSRDDFKDPVGIMLVDILCNDVPDGSHISIYVNHDTANKWNDAFVTKIPAVIMPYEKTCITLPYFGRGKIETDSYMERIPNFPHTMAVETSSSTCGKDALEYCFVEEDENNLFWLEPVEAVGAPCRDYEAYLGEYIVHFFPSE